MRVRSAILMQPAWLCTPLLLWLLSLSCLGPHGLQWRHHRSTQAEQDALADYKQTFRAAQGERIVEPVHEASLVQRMTESSIVFLGDRHDDQGLHAMHRSLLRKLAARRDLVLLVESVGSQDQSTINALLRGELDIESASRTIRDRWPGSWLSMATETSSKARTNTGTAGPSQPMGKDSPIDVHHYRAVLEFARDQRIPVQALEPTPRLDLEHRDAEMARTIAALRNAAPDAVIVVLVGQAHILGPHRLLERCDGPATVLLARLRHDLQTRGKSPAQSREFVRTDANIFAPTVR